MILVELVNLTFARELDVNRDANVKFAPLAASERAIDNLADFQKLRHHALQGSLRPCRKCAAVCLNRRRAAQA